MINIKTLMQTSVTTSPDGKHWEPALPTPSIWWRSRLQDAWAVWKGDASAIRQTTKQDLEKQND